MTKLFEMVFNVPMECDGCEQSVKNALQDTKGLEKLNIDWKSNVVSVIGFVPPSEIVSSLQKIGKDAIIRGTGAPNSAAVSILECFHSFKKNQSVKGLARIVAVDQENLVVDLTLSNLAEGTYYPQIRASGDLSEDGLSSSKIFHSFEPFVLSGQNTASSGNTLGDSHQQFLQARLRIMDIIGRSFVLSKDKEDMTEDSLCGVIARSAGAWENDKYVCTCSGKTIWQERVDALGKGITS